MAHSNPYDLPSCIDFFDGYNDKGRERDTHRSSIANYIVTPKNEVVEL